MQVTFPKVSDAGLATATSKFSADVSFDVVTDADRNIKVDNLEASVAIEELLVTVVKANHRWKLNKILGFFSERVRTIVEVKFNHCSCNYLRSRCTLTSRGCRLKFS